MGIFDGMGSANSRGNGTANGEWFQPGTYYVSVERHVQKRELQRGNFEGEAAVIVETRVEEVLAQGVTHDGQPTAANPADSKATAMYILQRKRTGELTKFGEMNMERLKGHFEVCLDSANTGLEVTEDVLEKLFAEGEEVLAGTPLYVEVVQALSKPKDGSPGKPFNKIYWKRASA